VVDGGGGGCLVGRRGFVVLGEDDLTGCGDCAVGECAAVEVVVHHPAVDAECEYGERGGEEGVAGGCDSAVAFELAEGAANVGIAEHAPGFVSHKRADGGDAHGHQQRDAVVHAAIAHDQAEEEESDGDFFSPGEVPSALVCECGFGEGGRGVAGFGEDRGLAEGEVQCVLGTDADAVEAFHAPWVDDGGVVADLFVDADVAGANGGAVAAGVAVVVDADAEWAEFVDGGEEAAVGAAVGAEGLCAEEVDGGESADEEEGDCDIPGWEGLPEVLDDEGLCEAVDGDDLTEPGGVFAEVDEAVGVGVVPEPACDEDFSAEGGPDEHVDGEDEWCPQEQACAPGLGVDAEFFHVPAAELLEGDDVAGPPAEEASEDEGGEDRGGEHDHAGVDAAGFEGEHALAWLDG